MLFFPTVLFGWIFYAALVGLLVAAAAIDLRRSKVPKTLSLSVLAVGVLMNVVRGAWLGAQASDSRPFAGVWVLGNNGPLTGAGDGLLFALAGFATGFALMFIMWIMGLCGGGDVKLFAAVSAWIGPRFCLWILLLSTVILMVLLVLRLAASFLFPRFKVPSPPPVDIKLKARAPRWGHAMTYSLSLALATAVGLPAFFHADLGL